MLKKTFLCKIEARLKYIILPCFNSLVKENQLEKLFYVLILLHEKTLNKIECLYLFDRKSFYTIFLFLYFEIVILVLG